MTAPDDDTRAPLDLEEVAQEVLELTAERTLEGLASRFLECLRRWAAPSAVLAAVRDPAAEGGWRLLPTLCAGSGPLGAERSVRQLVEELPEDLTRPSLVRPGHEIPGVKVRENCLVPWSCEGESGVLMLRGVAHPSAPNLADAVALLAAPAWPRMLGGPAERVESGVAELRRLAERLRDDAERQLQRLQAARVPAVEEPPAEDPVAVARLAELELQLTSARDEATRLASVVESLRSEGADAATRLEEERRRAEAARDEVVRLSSLVESLRSEGAGAAARLEEELRAAEAARGEVSRLSSLVESLQSEGAGAAARLEEELRAAEAARGEVSRLSSLVESLRFEGAGAADGLEEERRAAESARAEVSRLSALVELLRSEGADAAARLEEERRAAEEARAAARAAEEALATARKELTGAVQSAARAGFEREELRVQVITLEKALAEADDERNAAARGGAAAAASDSSQSGEILRGVLGVLRRTPFAPAPLRVAAQEAEAAVGAKAIRPPAWARVALLDRDIGGLESLAAELEEAGLDVKLASHPEELTLLLKTSEGRELDATICDVLAFRPDQNVAGLFRSWEKDRPGLALYLSLGRDSQPEVERAQRVPQSLTKGRFQRPLNRPELVAMLEPLRRRTP